MAGMMETLYSTSGFTSEASLSGVPHSPPYTPARATKRRLERADSPASTVGSIHPAETHSPAKKAAKRAATDNIQVEELAEGDMGYATDIDVVYPEELEEISSDDSSDGCSDERNTASDVSDSEATGLTRKLSRLRCGDDRDVDFEEFRRRKHLHKRTDSRIYKRSHSQSVKSEMEVTDTDAMDDHDLGGSQRRLRRRVRGPREVGVASEHIRSSPEAGNISAAADDHVEENSVQPADAPDAMEVDDAK